MMILQKRIAQRIRIANETLEDIYKTHPNWYINRHNEVRSETFAIIILALTKLDIERDKHGIR